MSLFGALGNHVFSGISGNTAYDVIQAAWQKATERSWEDLYLDAFKEAFSAAQPQLKKYAAIDGELSFDIEKFKQLLHQDLHTNPSNASYSQLIADDFLIKLAATMEYHQVVSIGGHNLPPEGYAQLVSNLVQHARSVFSEAVLTNQAAFQKAIIDLSKDTRSSTLDIQAYLQNEFPLIFEKLYEIVSEVRSIQKERNAQPDDRALVQRLCNDLTVRDSGIVLPRTELTEAFVEFARHGNGVVIGAPGVGKTYQLKKFSMQLMQQEILCFCLPLDQLSVVESHATLQVELGINQPLIDYLGGLKSRLAVEETQPGILLIDAFDAARSENSRRFFLNLIRRAIENLSGDWNIIVSARTYDATRSAELLNLFPPIQKEKLRTAFQLDEVKCRHFYIPQLSFNEVQSATEAIPSLPEIYEQGTDEFREMLRIPFNLWLAQEILAWEDEPELLTTVRSEVELLERYWHQRIDDPDVRVRTDMQALLLRATKVMVAQSSLSAYEEEIREVGRAHEAWEQLLSREILVRTSRLGQRVKFSHNILFDFAVANVLIDDEPKQFVNFIREDPSRPLFLRPSLDYFFSSMWYEKLDHFWTMCRYLLDQDNSAEIALRLMIRILPPSIVVREARTPAQLLPLVWGLEQGIPNAPQTIQYILEALRALHVTRDELWSSFLHDVVGHMHREFAWGLLLVTSEIFNRAKAIENNEIRARCGEISRRAFDWFWEERATIESDWMNRLGASKIIPLVAQTFDTEPLVSRTILENTLEDLVQTENFSIDLLRALVDSVSSIWSYDPELATIIYRTVFGRQETSQDPTHIGGYVISMWSNRRQDFETCQYSLITAFPQFLEEQPIWATIAAVQSLNRFVLVEYIARYSRYFAGEKSLENIVKPFQFRGRQTHYLADGSVIWDRNHQPTHPFNIADRLFGYVADLAASEKTNELIAWIDIFSEHAWVALLWNYLLKIASQYPAIFAPLLYELCVATPILEGNEVLHALGVFLEAAASEFTADQLYAIEETIIALPKNEKDPHRREVLQRRRNRLLARIPAVLLQTNEAIELRQAMEEANKLPDNAPLVSFSSWTSTLSEDDLLREKGVNLEDEVNQALKQKYMPLVEFNDYWQNKKTTLEAVLATLPVARELFETYLKETKAEEDVVDSAWISLARFMATTARFAKELEIEDFLLCRDTLLSCAEHRLPEPNPEADAAYDFPGWSCLPRNEAADSLAILALRQFDEQIELAIRRLVRDNVPDVRFPAVSKLYLLLHNAPDTFWNLAMEIAEQEQNGIILAALCHSLSQVRPLELTVPVLETLFQKISFSDPNPEKSECLASLLADLLLTSENGWSRQTFERMTNDPAKYAKALHRIVLDAVSVFRVEKVVTLLEESPTERALVILRNTSRASIQGIQLLQAEQAEEWNEATKNTLRDLYNAIGSIIIHLYFGADIDETTREKRKSQLTESERRAYYFKIKPLLLHILTELEAAKIAMPANAAHDMFKFMNGVLRYDPVGVLNIVARTTEDSRSSGYPLDSLAIPEVQKLVECILADHRDQVQATEPLQDLFKLLLIFAEAGWPEASQLVWRLDEIFR